MMKDSTIFAAYLKSKGKALLLFGAMLIILFVVYGLYGLSYAPAVYTAVLMAAVLIFSGIFGFFAYREKVRQLHLMKKQAEQFLDEPPHSGSLIDESYLDIIRTLEAKHKNACERAQKEFDDATQYYTLWSHQIKTPVAAMRLLLQEDFLERRALERELFKTEQYIEMVLQYRRLHMTENDLVLKEHRLEVLVKQAVKRVAPLFIHKKLGVQIGEMQCTVLTDEKWLLFVLEQLLSNAVKYTASGKISIYLEGEGCKLVIEDEGMGIMPEDLPRVFEWGYTGYNGRLNNRSTGIGLSLCRQALALIGNTISITSVVGKGTRVIIDLSRGKLDTE